VDGYSQLRIQPEPSASAGEKERPADPRIEEALFKRIVSLTEQCCAKTAHYIKWSCGSRSTPSWQPVKKLQTGRVQLADQILAQTHLEYLAIPCLQEYTVKKPRSRAHFKPALCRQGTGKQ